MRRILRTVPWSREILLLLPRKLSISRQKAWNWKSLTVVFIACCRYAHQRKANKENNNVVSERVYIIFQYTSSPVTYHILLWNSPCKLGIWITENYGNKANDVNHTRKCVQWLLCRYRFAYSYERFFYGLWKMIVFAMKAKTDIARKIRNLNWIFYRVVFLEVLTKS